MSRSGSVVGVGNLLRQDDGVGIHTIRALEGRVPSGVEVIDAGVSVLDALLDTDGTGFLIFVDALAGGGPPGTIYRVPVADLIDGQHPSPDRQELGTTREGGEIRDQTSLVMDWRQLGAISLHEVSLTTALALARVARIQLDGAVLIGMEPATLDWGTELSPEVQARLPALVESVLAEIVRGRSEHADKHPQADG